MEDDNIEFPLFYYGIELTRPERFAIVNFLKMSGVTGMLSELDDFSRKLIEQRYVADALCLHAKSLLETSAETGNRNLAQIGCESAERAALIAKDEPIYHYRLATFLEYAGFLDQSLHYYKIFVNRSAKDIGSIGHSPLEAEGYQVALKRAKSLIEAAC